MCAPSISTHAAPGNVGVTGTDPLAVASLSLDACGGPVVTRQLKMDLGERGRTRRVRVLRWVVELGSTRVSKVNGIKYFFLYSSRVIDIQQR